MVGTGNKSCVKLAFPSVELLAVHPFLYSGQLADGWPDLYNVPALTARTVPIWSCVFAPPAVPIDKITLGSTSTASSLINVSRYVAPGQSRWVFDLNSSTGFPLTSTNRKYPQ